MEKAKKKFQMPHIFVVLYAIILVIAILTYIVPAGSYERFADPVTGRNLVDATTFAYLGTKNPTTVMQYFGAFFNGICNAVDVVALTFFVCGGFFVVNSTGVIAAAISALAKKLKDKGILIIPILMVTFAAIDCFIGMCELCMVYVPIILPLMLALGFDSLTACATALCGSAIGFTSAIANPFTTIIGQKIAGIPLMSGWEFRLVSLIVIGVIGIAYVMNYARKVKANPESSIMYESDLELRKILGTDNLEVEKLNGRKKAAGIIAIGMFVFMVYGVISLGWDLPEMAGIFLMMAVVCGLVAGMSLNEIAEKFLEGCHDTLLGALVVGCSRGVLVVMQSANITDTIVHAFAGFLINLPPTVTSVGMVIVNTIMNFLIPSGSGQAVVMMPIMSPLADIVGVSQNTAILALQYGDGFSNIFYPVSGYFMATLALGHVPYDKWIKKMLPLFGIWTVVACVFMVIAQVIGWA